MTSKFHFEIGETKFYTAVNQCAQPDRMSLLQSAWSMALSAMTVECE